METARIWAESIPAFASNSLWNWCENSMKNEPTRCSQSCDCRSEVSRRDLLRWTGAGAVALGVRPWNAIAGPFESADFENLVPRDKKLSPEWIRSLFERGKPTVYDGSDLEWIGMPVGGLCAGQLYLGGDGRLWHWDIFNQRIGTGSEHYAKPMRPSSALEQGFVLRIDDRVRKLDQSGFRQVRFRGEYPIARVEYADETEPVSVTLDAFSPFVPLSYEDSSLPATVLQFTVKNGGDREVEVELAGWLENAVCLFTGSRGAIVRRNRILRTADLLCLECHAVQPSIEETETARPDVIFEQWEGEAYDGWSVTGNAFGAGPLRKSDFPGYQGDVGGTSERVTNSHATAPGDDVGQKDDQVGSLTSAPFVIERNYVNFWIGGGNHPKRTCLNLLVEDQVVLSATGHNDNKMRQDSFDVRQLQGKTARLQILDDQRGPWGNVGIGTIVFSDRPAGEIQKLEERHDYGTMTLSLLNSDTEDRGTASCERTDLPASAFESRSSLELADDSSGERPVGSLSRRNVLEPGAETTVSFLLTWHFPNDQIDGIQDRGRYYSTKFSDAFAVARHVASHFDTLCDQTRLWRDTWYDSTLPYWFLDRTFLNTSILATSTCHRFASGRFYGWEGVGCCPGTCTHVWQYAQAVARLFPSLERDLRERTDLGIAFAPETGVIRFRAEQAGLAVDGQAGCILRSYREHQMSPDENFLERNWTKIKRALQCLIDKDADANGILESGQHNTLDADWYGPVAWLSGLYLAALRAGEEMAREVGDEAFAAICRRVFDQGQKNLVEQLFDREYFINKPDPDHPEAINSGTGCEIDQVFGQSWAWQVGLGRVLPERETHSALESLWRYNFTPDVGPYRQANQPGRWYAMPGEAGLLMCTFPRDDWDYEKAAGKGPNWAAGYFNECMNGFEYQVAGHMIWEGMLEHGLAVTRAVHDRYHASRRNPWNEVECGDHYARSMASYGVFLAACGFEYHGPLGHIGFAPRISAEDFRAAFTSAEGWGTYRQAIEDSTLRAELLMRWGRLRLKTIALAVPQQPSSVRVLVDGQQIGATHQWNDRRLTILLDEESSISAGQKMAIEVKA